MADYFYDAQTTGYVIRRAKVAGSNSKLVKADYGSDSSVSTVHRSQMTGSKRGQGAPARRT